MSTEKQITIKGIGCDPKQAPKTKSKVFLCRIFGEATGHKLKEGKNGDAYSLLIGAFRAVRPAPAQTTIPGTEVPETQTAEYDSEVLLLPGGMEDRILALLKANKGKAVQFAYDVSAVPDPAVPIGYQYAASVVMAPAISDHVKALSVALENVPTPGALKSTPPAPASPAAPAPAPAESKKVPAKKAAGR